MGQPSASPQQATWLGWIPLPALVLAGDASAVAVNDRWADLSPVPADGQGWLEAAEPEVRQALRATLLMAAAGGDPGSADCPVIGPRGGRRSRWWWQPFPPGGLVVCVAVTGTAPARGSPTAGGARDPFAREHARAARPDGISAELGMAAVHRIFQAGLALESAASLLPRPAAALVLGVIDDLDQLVRDIRNAVLKQPTRRTTPPHEVQGEAAIPAITPATRELLDSVVNDIFTAGMSLQAAIGLPLPSGAAQRITEALRSLDEAVREVRDHVLTGHGQQAQPGQLARPGPGARERRELAHDHAAAQTADRAALLRGHMARTARALQASAADYSALLERMADLAGQPGRIDYPTEIKRWRVFADQAEQMAERWEHG